MRETVGMIEWLEPSDENILFSGPFTKERIAPYFSDEVAEQIFQDANASLEGCSDLDRSTIEVSIARGKSGARQIHVTARDTAAARRFVWSSPIIDGA